MDIHEDKESLEKLLHGLRWLGSRLGLATKQDLEQLLEIIMATQAELIAAAAALSTASDAASLKIDAVDVKVGDLITKVDAVVAALQGADLPPEATAAIAAMKASADTATAATASAAAAGDKIDAEVTKLDGVLPTPAPAAPRA